MQKASSKIACLALSGGLDSSSLLIHLLAGGYQVTALSFLYGQKHLIEISCAENLVAFLAEKGHKVSHHKIELKGLENLLFSSLMQNGAPIPEGHYTNENMQSTVVPNRNKIFISILQSTALSIATKLQTNVQVAMGIHAGDFVTYPDCRPEFIEQDYQAFLKGNWQAERVENYLPYQFFDKYSILKDGLKSCQDLQLDFDEVYRRTITSYNPDMNGHSDYKSSASISRIEAFIKLNRQDPILYADEQGLVDWNTAKNHALQVLKQSATQDAKA